MGCFQQFFSRQKLKANFGTMGMPLRITFNDVDYNFKVVNTEPITKKTTKIPIIINGETIELIKDTKGWISSTAKQGIESDLIQAIGRAIELRFRL
ncbi:hypothetical protein [Desertivirga brevis]|uniref:hypothetical protein n=1 Tax=Desertivirga brevis TaxID=2810310 RepID=UPI001A961797|nr:hypothetical protein [Pedobacter sp. SYSU D00873]